VRKILSRLFLILFDVLAIYTSIILAFFFVKYISICYDLVPVGGYIHYIDKLIVYVIIIASLYGLDIYKYRHDFWEETYLILKALVIPLFVVLALLALSKAIFDYSNVVVVVSFVIMGFLIPLTKYILKKKLSVFGFWKKRANVISGNSDIIHEIFANQYLGYVKSSSSKSEVIFIDTAGSTLKHIKNKISKLMHQKKEIIFIPLLNSFNYSKAGIIEVFNSRTNMIVLENSLLKRRNIVVKKVSDMILSILLMPLLLPIFAIIIYLIKREEPNGSIFFIQDRLGKNEEIFKCYKFRSMREDGDIILEEYLKENPQEVENYSIYHKYENDPRVTKIGAFMRKTSLDELPQIINYFNPNQLFNLHNNFLQLLEQVYKLLFL